MWTKLVISCLLTGAGLCNGFLFDLNLDLHAGLQRGGKIEGGSGQYLQDDFCKNVLIPAFYNIQKALEENKRSDVIVKTGLSIAMVVVVAGILTIWMKVKSWKKESVNLESKA